MKSYSVKFEDWGGETATETYYFNLTETELSLLNSKYNGSLIGTLARLTRDNSPKEAMEILMDVIKAAYGVMDDDRRHFRKASTNPKIWEDFVSSAGFNKFFMDVMSDDKKTAEFIRGIMPKSVQDAVDNDADGGREASKKFEELTAADVSIV